MAKLLSMEHKSTVAQEAKAPEMVGTNVRLREDLHRRARIWAADPRHQETLQSLINEGLELRLNQLEKTTRSREE
jgi:predicted HicB family RNase H-like nuclease